MSGFSFGFQRARTRLSGSTVPVDLVLARASSLTGVAFASAGPRSATTKRAGVDALPAGMFISGALVRANSGATATLSGWDLSDYTLYIDQATANVTVVDCKLGSATARAIDVRAGTVAGQWLDIDQQRGASGAAEAVYNSPTGSTLSILDTRIHGTAEDFIKPGSNFTLGGCWLYDGGYKVGGHFDGIQASVGNDTPGAVAISNISITGNLIDGRANNAVKMETALRLLAERGSDLSNVEVDNNVFLVEATVGTALVLGRRSDGFQEGFAASNFTVSNLWIDYGATLIYAYDAPTGYALWQDVRRFDDETTIAPPSGWSATLPVTLTDAALVGSLTQGVAASGVTITGVNTAATVTVNIAGLTISGSGTTRTVTGTPATSGSISVTQTLAGAANTPHTNVVGTVAAGGGTSASRYSFTGSGFRQATQVWTVNASFPYQAFDQTIGTPDWAVDDFYLFFPLYYGQTAGEVQTTATVTVEGISFLIGGSWVAATVDAGVTPVINPANSPTQYGKWVRITGVTLPANTLVRMRVAQQMSAGTVARSGLSHNTTLERGQGSASSLAATLTNNATLANSNSQPCRPTAMMAKGGDGRPAVFVLGTSIDFGQDQSTNPAFSDARGEVGYMAMGLDDNASSKRIPYLNWAIPGQGTAQQGVSSGCARQIWAIQQAVTLNGGEAPCDMLICGHGTNSVTLGTGLVQALRDLYTLWRTTLGKPTLPVMQTEMLPYPSSSDGFSTLANQAGSTASAVYPTGARWTTNEAIGGPNGLGDPAATLRADGSIQSSVGLWRASAYDLTTNRDKLKVRSFNTTLAAAWTTGASLSMTAAPSLGMYLSVYDAVQGTETVLVTAVTGSGPYTVSVNHNTQPLPGGGMPSGATVRDTWHGGGLHPGPNAHSDYKAMIVDWKIAQGWV